MNSEPSTKNNVIGRNNVRLVAQAAMLHCGTITDDAQNQQVNQVAVVPLLDGDRVAGFEVRCGCGGTAIIECVYDDAHNEESQS